jgi:hypothetical protein
MRYSLLLSFSVAIAVPTLVACNPYDPDLHPTPFECGDQGQCPEGYSCNEADNVCTRGGDAPQVDASTVFQCADDSSFGSNDNPGTAYITSIGMSTRELSLASLSICPVGDRDHFRFTAELDNLYLELSAIGMGDRAPLQINLLNQNGTSLGSAAPLTGTPQIVRLPNPNNSPVVPYQLARGTTYVVQVQSGDQTQNNYELTIKTCQDPPCD